MGLKALTAAADTINVGILHSLSVTMAISETVLKDTVLMAMDEINAKGSELADVKKFAAGGKTAAANPWLGGLFSLVH